MRRWALSLTLAAGLIACGKSGSHPRFLPEVRFLVAPLGGQQGTTFKVDFLASARALHVFEPGRTFTATEPVGFFLENAVAPYTARFTWIDGGDADILLIVSGRTIQISPDRLGSNVPSRAGVMGTVELTSVGADPNEFATSSGNPEVRLEVSGAPGTLFQGTIGDLFLSYNVGLTIDDDETLVPRAPAIIFFEDASETISAVVRNPSGLQITIDLYLDGDLKESDTSNKDAIVKRDL